MRWNRRSPEKNAHRKKSRVIPAHRRENATLCWQPLGVTGPLDGLYRMYVRRVSSNSSLETPVSSGGSSISKETPLETLETPLETLETPLETLEAPADIKRFDQNHERLGIPSPRSDSPRPMCYPSCLPYAFSTRCPKRFPVSKS